MKVYKTIAIAFAVLLAWCGQSTAYETFSADRIDASRWQDLEFVRMHSPGDGNMRLAARSEESGDEVRSHLRFSDPASIYAVQTDVNVETVDVSQNANGDATAEVRIQGFFYSTQPSPTGSTGDVYAVVWLGSDGSGLKAGWSVEVVDDDTLTTTTVLASGELGASQTFSLNTTYKLELEYDPDAGQFRFAVYDAMGMTIGSAQHAFTNRMGPAYFPWRTVSGIAYNDTAFIDAVVDNVSVRTSPSGAYTLYDDFTTFDTGNWQDVQAWRRIMNGKLASGVQSTGTTQTNDLRFVDAPDFIQARVAVSSASAIPAGGRGEVRINGYFFNDTKPPAQQTGYTGDVWAQVRIRDTGGNLVASAYVGKSLSDDQSQFEDTWSETFDGISIAYDTPYILTLDFTGTAFNFSIGDGSQTRTLTYTLPQGTQIYDAYGAFCSLRTRVYGDAGGGTIDATFDNVRTSPLADGWETISGTVSKDGTSLCAMVLANGQYMFSCGDDLGKYQLDVPLDAAGEITIQVFVSGLAPYRLTYDTSELDRDVVMQAADPASASPAVTRTIAPDASTPAGWTRLTGTVQRTDGTPLCAMVLANGQYMFSCGDDLGQYDLTVPLDGSGNVTHYVFVSGLQPYKEVFAP